ncbi:helicase HerA-like domain-containing protein [Sphingosinicella sp. YJ22]|uniref:helicase HerA-like domain-containing protein n=1 Tax=Sphingosinicella sp. YJ22 TaxID=1104780 RepID=UPI00140987CA|nr:helicase HerA-like domain-containing protein [Sphingosinicella sp. YJ22]
MASDDGILIGGSTAGPERLRLDRANRHGLVAGATGTGKTVTLQTMAEGFSRAGVPVFAADIKGDLSGMAMPGNAQQRAHEAFTARAAELGLGDWSYADNPVVFWDLFGEQGHPIRTTVSEMGPLLLSRLLGLNETQEGVLAIAFRAADDEGMLLLNLDDLRSMLTWVGDNAADLTSRYGNVARQSVGTIQRQLLAFEAQGADRFFGEPALEIADFLGADDQGRGIGNILAADKLMQSPKLYATFLLWLLSELFEELPEVGDLDRPRLVFFFDEAHLLFDDVPAALLDKVEQVVRLIRSKGVGVYFVTQNPLDIPEAVAAQLGNRVQHALRAFTPKDQRAVAAAAETFRTNPDLDVASAITELRTGEALVSVLDSDGAPTPVQRTLVAPPRSRAGPITETERQVLQSTSDIGAKYRDAVDRESAHEMLQARTEQAAAAAAAEKARRDEEKAAIQRDRTAAREEREQRRNQGMAGELTRQLGRSVQRQVVNRVAGQIVRGLLGGLFRGR